MALRDTFLNMLGVETPEVQKTSNGAIKSARDFLRYGNREKLYPSWSDIQMPDSDMYRGYSYAVIQKRGNKVASLAKNNLKTWAKQEIVDEYQKREEQVLHPYLKVIEDSTKFTEKQFWKNISIYLDLAGRYYLGVIRNEIKPLNPKLPVITTDPTEFVMLNPYEIRRVIDKNGNVAGYIERKKDGRYREWPLHQIIEMRELNPFDPENSQWAMTDAAKSAVYTINQSSDYTKQSLNGNIDAPGIITTDVLLSDEDFANFRARVTQHVKGEPLFGNGTGAIKWDSMQVDLDKAALMDINEINRTELFAVSGTSKTSLGIEQSGTTRETARVQSEQFISDTAQPRLEDIVDFLNLDYKKYYTREYKKTGYTIEVESAVGRDYDTETKATALKQTQFQLAMQLIQSGYTTQSAYQFAEGNIEFEDLELEKGLDKPKNPEQPEEGLENNPTGPQNGPQSGSGSGNGNNNVPENNSLENAINDLSELEPHADLIENGGKGSGNFDHAGRPGLVGGSAPSGSVSHSEEETPENVVKTGIDVNHPILTALSSKGIGSSLSRTEVESLARSYLEKAGFDLSEDTLMSFSDKGNSKDVLSAIEHGRLATAKHRVEDVLKDDIGWHNPRTFGENVGLDTHGMKEGDEFVQSKEDYFKTWTDYDSQVDKKLEKHKNFLELNGGKGSGNFGHAGRPGEVGGSAPSGSVSGSSVYDKISKLTVHDKQYKFGDDVLRAKSCEFLPEPDVLIIEGEGMNERDERIQVLGYLDNYPSDDDITKALRFHRLKPLTELANPGTEDWGIISKTLEHMDEEPSKKESRETAVLKRQIRKAQEDNAGITSLKQLVRSNEKAVKSTEKAIKTLTGLLGKGYGDDKIKQKIKDTKSLLQTLKKSADANKKRLEEKTKELDDRFKNSYYFAVNGGEGSGNFGHLGRPGLIGGSSKDGYRGISFSKSAEESFKEYPNRKKEFDRVVEEFRKIGLKRGFHFTMNAFDVAAKGEGLFDVGKYSGRTVTETAEGGSTVYISPTLLKEGIGKKSNFEKDGKTYEVDDTFAGVLRHELGHLFMTQLFLTEYKGKVSGDLSQSAFDRYNNDILFNSKCNRPFLGGKWSYYADMGSGEAIAEAFSNPDYSEDTKKVFDYVKSYNPKKNSLEEYQQNSTKENVIVACIGYPVDDEALKEYMAKVEKNQCTCGHEHKVETFINEVREDEAKIVSEEYKDFLTEVREIEKETIDAVANKLTINAFEPDDIITPKKKKSLLEKLKNAIHNYWWIIFPLFASNSMSKRNEEFDEDIEFVFNNDLQTGVDDNAERVAEGHLETILKDILDASNRAYTKVVENAAAEVIIKVYDENPEKLSDYFDEKPTMADALESIQKTDILEENRKIYEKANKMAFEGFKREDIVKAIRNEYSHISETRATLIARNETARAFGRSQFEADKQFLNSIGKMEQAYKVWYSRRPESEKDKICAFCQELIDRSNANPIPFEEPFLKYGDSMEVVENGKVKIFTANYENIEGGTLHPNCACGYHLVFKNSAGEFVKTLNGGKGSGNWGHAGRPGEVGGSAPQGSQNPETTDESYESLRAEEDSLGYLLELEYGSNIVKYVKEQLGAVKTVEKYLDKVPEDMREQMTRGLETTKKDLERAVEIHKKTLGDDLTAENFEEKYEAYKKSMQTRLDEVRAKIGKMRSEKRTIDLVADSKTPDMDYIGSEKKRIDIARKSIGIFEDDGSLASDWLNGEIGEAKPEIRKAIEKDKELRQACLSQMYYDSNSKADFKDWLKTPVTLRRVQFSDKVNKDSGFLSFSQYGEWEGTGQGHNKTFPGDILEVKIKPQDTLGSIPAHEGYAYVEGEVMVPTELVVKALEKKQKNNLDKNVNGGKGSGNFGHSGRPGLVGGSAPAGTSPAVAIYVTGEEAKMDFDTILQRRDLQQKLKRMRKIDDFNDDVVAEMKKLQFTDEEIERWRAMILAKEVVHIMDRDKRREKRAQISDSAEQKEAIEKVVDSVEMEDKDKTWLRNNCDVEMAQALSREIDRAKESGIDKIRLKLNDSKSINGRMGYIAGRDEYELTLRKGLLRDTEQTKASRERQGPNGGRYKSSDDIGGTFAHEFGHALETVFAKSLVGDRGIAKSSMYMGEITSFTSRAIVEQAKRNMIAKGIGKEELFRNADNKYMSAYGRVNVREAIAESHANPNFSEFTREVENIVTRKVPIDKDLLDPILNRINFREKQYQEFLHGKD